MCFYYTRKLFSTNPIYIKDIIILLWFVENVKLCLVDDFFFFFNSKPNSPHMNSYELFYEQIVSKYLLLYFFNRLTKDNIINLQSNIEPI